MKFIQITCILYASILWRWRDAKGVTPAYVSQVSTVLTRSPIRSFSNPWMCVVLDCATIIVFPYIFSLLICNGEPNLHTVPPFAIYLFLQKGLENGPVLKSGHRRNPLPKFSQRCIQESHPGNGVWKKFANGAPSHGLLVSTVSFLAFPCRIHSMFSHAR